MRKWLTLNQHRNGFYENEIFQNIIFKANAITLNITNDINFCQELQLNYTIEYMIDIYLFINFPFWNMQYAK